MFVTFDILNEEIFRPVILLQFMNISFIVVTLEVSKEVTLIEVKLEQSLNIQSRLVALVLFRLCCNDASFLHPQNIYPKDVDFEELKFRMSRLVSEEHPANIVAI